MPVCQSFSVARQTPDSKILTSRFPHHDPLHMQTDTKIVQAPPNSPQQPAKEPRTQCSCHFLLHVSSCASCHQAVWAASSDPQQSAKKPTTGCNWAIIMFPI